MRLVLLYSPWTYNHNFEHTDLQSKITGSHV